MFTASLFQLKLMKMYESGNGVNQEDNACDLSKEAKVGSRMIKIGDVYRNKEEMNPSQTGR